ncbi:MAG: hypothetical protein ACFFC7_22075 [Candidatus Hermodarchaeota archaeon]
MVESPANSELVSFRNWLDKWFTNMLQDDKAHLKSNINHLIIFLTQEQQKTSLKVKSFQNQLLKLCIELNNLFHLNLSTTIDNLICSFIGLENLKKRLLEEFQIGVQDSTNCLTGLDLFCLYQALNELPRHLIPRWTFKFDEIEGDTPRGEADGWIHLPRYKTMFQKSSERRFWEFPPIVTDGQETSFPVRQSFFYRMLLIRVFKHEIGHKVFGRAMKYRYWPESKHYVGGKDNPWQIMREMLYHPEVIFIYGLAHVLEDLATMFQAIATNALGVIHEAVSRATTGHSLYYSKIPGRTFKPTGSNSYLLIKTIHTLSIFVTSSSSSPSSSTLALTYNKLHYPPKLDFLQDPPLVSENGPIVTINCETVQLTPTGCLQYVSWYNPITCNLESIEIDQNQSSVRIILTGFSSDPFIVEGLDPKFFYPRS